MIYFSFYILRWQKKLWKTLIQEKVSKMAHGEPVIHEFPMFKPLPCVKTFCLRSSLLLYCYVMSSQVWRCSKWSGRWRGDPHKIEFLCGGPSRWGGEDQQCSHMWQDGYMIFTSKSNVSVLLEGGWVQILYFISECIRFRESNGSLV